MIWLTADKPNTPFIAARDPDIARWYQEDQVFDVVRSDELKIDRTSQVSLAVTGELADDFDGTRAQWPSSSVGLIYARCT